MPEDTATKRLSVRDKTLRRMRNLTDGLGDTYDVALNLLLDAYAEPGESDFDVGLRLREILVKRMREARKVDTESDRRAPTHLPIVG